MAKIRLCSIYDTDHHLPAPAITYMMAVQGKRGYPDLVYKGIHLFQPTKEMVFGHKHHANPDDPRFASWPPIDDQQYTDAYRLIIARQMPLIKEWYSSLGDLEQLTLCCYCSPGKFCHRQFVEKTLTWLNTKLNRQHTVNLF